MKVLSVLEYDLRGLTGAPPRPWPPFTGDAAKLIVDADSSLDVRLLTMLHNAGVPVQITGAADDARAVHRWQVFARSFQPPPVPAGPVDPWDHILDGVSAP